jgi:hypothetical protein
VPFEILLRKPTSRKLDDNRLWVVAVRAQFPGFEEERVDHVQLAADLAEDIGLTPREYLARGIGLGVDCGSDSSIHIGFWDSSVSVELPNFPPAGTEQALSAALPIVAFLLSLGFALLDPTSGLPTSEEPVKVLTQGYAARQEQLRAVATLTGGTAQ